MPRVIALQLQEERQWIERIRAGDATAFEAMFKRYHGPLCAYVSAKGEAVLVKRPSEPAVAPAPPKPVVGTIAGRVTDASSGAGVSGATVLLEGTGLRAVTGNTGRYRIVDVPAGTYTIVVEQLGYAEAAQSATVSDGGETTVDFALEVSALPMDQIVATGTAFAAELRTLPNPITVITANEIEAKGATNRMARPARHRPGGRRAAGCARGRCGSRGA